MLKIVLHQIRIASSLLALLTILTGLLYPACITTIAQLCFPVQANGSLIKQNSHIIGSLLIGQSFTDRHYFWGRPSATLPYPYNAARSSGSNLAPSNQALLITVKNRIQQLKQADPHNLLPIPVDLVTASGSGLDPEISPYAAFYQAHRIAQARGIPETEVRALIRRYTKNRTLGILGEPRVNVLQLNMALTKHQ